MLTPVPVVGFDLDMTLVDSSPGITSTFMAAAAQASDGALHLTAEQIWPFIGLPLEITAEALAGDADPARIVAAYRELYLVDGARMTTVMPGAIEALTAVRAAHGRILLVSAKRPAAVTAVLEQVGLDRGDLLPDLIAGDRFAGAKGELLLAEGAHIYVGDHPGDVEAARVGGCTAVGVATGPASPDDLAAAGADVVLADLLAFPAWLDNWLENRPVQRAGPHAG